jgi:hypothetical protein
MTARQTAALVFVLTLIGCASSYEAKRARKAADGFWAANMAGEVGVAEKYVLEGSSATLSKPEDGKPPFEGYTLGDVDVKGNRATVETWISGVNGNPGVDMEFKTSLILSRNIWWIDLDRTTGEIMQVMLGINMEEFGEAMEEAMGKAMEGMADEMQASMEQMGKEMDAAMTRSERSR